MHTHTLHTHTVTPHVARRLMSVIPFAFGQESENKYSMCIALHWHAATIALHSFTTRQLTGEVSMCLLVFVNTKSDLGKCLKVHDDKLKDMFQNVSIMYVHTHTH